MNPGHCVWGHPMSIVPELLGSCDPPSRWVGGLGQRVGVCENIPKERSRDRPTQVPVWVPAWMVLLILGVPRHWRKALEMGQDRDPAYLVPRARQYCFQQLNDKNSTFIFFV